MLKRRTYNIWLSVVLPAVLFAALLGVLIWGLVRDAKATKYETATKSMYSRAYNELVNELNNLEVTLSKIQIAGTKAQYILLLDDVWKSCGTCTALMSQIPSSHRDSYEMTQFLTRVGDYAKTLSTNIIHGEVLSANDMKQLSELRNTSLELAVKVTERYDEGKFPDELITADGYYEHSSEEYETEETRQKYPTLIYDGPFSESAEKATPKGLTGDDISRTTAYNIALEYIGKAVGLEFSSDSDGDIPSYDFSGQLADGRQVDISISKKGGHLVWYMSSATSNISGTPDESALKAYKKAGLNYLDTHGYKNMESTYAQFYDGIILINYAAKKGDVILYNDLVKVWVDRGTGEIVGADAKNYLYSHVKRTIKPAEISKEDAKIYISDNLKIKDINLALIPASPENEVLCYEFKGEFGGQSYIVYINAWTGEEQQIFRIIDTDSGALVV